MQLISKTSVFMIICVISVGCSNKTDKNLTLSELFTGNTLVGKDYATYFPDTKTSIMDWQGKITTRLWWIDEGQFCHATGDGTVCELVNRLGENENGEKLFEFCGRWGCFPATLKKGDVKNLSR